MRGCSEVEKRIEIGLMFEDFRLDILGLSATTFKRKEEMCLGEWGGKEMREE